MLPILAPRASDPQNAMLISDMPSGRLIRVNDVSETGIQTGPTADGLSFNMPWHFSVDSSGRIYVADRDNLRIVRLDDVAGTNWAALNVNGADRSGFLVSTAVDSAGRIYVAGYGRVQRVDNMGGSGWISMGPGSNGPGSFGGPKGMTLDRQGRIYVVDNGSGRIVRMDDMQARGWVTFGSIGYGVGQFYRPEGAALDSTGRIYITDNDNHRVVRINDMTGAGWTTFGTYGHGDGQLWEPHDIRIDSADRIWISDTGNQRVVRINSMTGDGWVTFGNREPQGRELRLQANNGIHVFGLGPALTYLSILPRVTVGNGYRTTIVAVNTRPVGADAEISFLKWVNRPCDGDAIDCSSAFPVTVDGVPASNAAQSIGPMGTMRFEVTAGSAMDTGYARVHSSDEVHAVALVRAMRGNTITSEAGFRLSSPSDHFTVYIDNANSALTGYTVINPAPEGAGIPGRGWVSVTMTLRDKAGATMETRTVNMMPGRSFTELASEGFPANVGAGFEGSVEFSTGISYAKLEATTLRYDNAASDVFTALPVILNVEAPRDDRTIPGSPATPRPSATTTLLYPHIADGGSYRTEFVLVNTSDRPATAALEFFGSDGAPLSLPVEGIQRTRHVISLSARAVDHFVTDGTSSEIKWGWARVTAGTTIGGAAILKTAANGVIASEAMVSASLPASHFTTYVDNLASADSGVAIGNLNNSVVSVTFRPRDSGGQVVASTTSTLSPLGYLAQFFTQLFPGFSEFEGSLEVQTNGPAVSTTGLRYESADRTVFTTTPVAVLP